MRQRRSKGMRALSAALLLVPSLAVAAQQPHDVAGGLHAKDHAATFYAGEVITLEASFTSSSPNKYLEPCEILIVRSFGYPQCRFFSPWTLSVQTPDGAWTPIKEPTPMFMSGPTFDVPDHDLTTTPKSFSYDLTAHRRFQTPGKYTVRLTTQIALDDDSTKRRPGGSYAGSKPAPNMEPLTLDYTFSVIPATAEWKQQIIAHGIEALERKEPPKEQELAAVREATRALCDLNTPDAILALVHVFADGYDASCITSVDDRAAAAAELHRLVPAPEAAVTPQLLRALASLEQPQNSEWSGQPAPRTIRLDELREELFAALPAKRPQARRISLVTALSASSFGGWSYESDKPHAFSEPMIQATAEVLNTLPDDVRLGLLGREWWRIRSPLMLKAVRAEAERGEGQAILDWQDLDPAGAAEFIRAEIARPIPRFYAYYLRLPERTLSPELEAQLAAHTVTLPNGHDLGPAATLIARYGTAASLAQILSFYDQHIHEWYCSASEPLLAYLLRVAPKEAEPRLEAAFEQNTDWKSSSPCHTSAFLTELGTLQPSPLLEELALRQLETDTSSSRDAADYLRKYGSPTLKPRVWSALVAWKARKHTDPQAENSVLPYLIKAYTSAQGWLLSAEDVAHLRELLDAKVTGDLACNFACGHALDTSPSPAEFTLNRFRDGFASDTSRLWLRAGSSDYKYSINQYGASTLEQFFGKLSQFPAGSTFSFRDQDAGPDHTEWVMIRDFLLTHGDHVRIPPEWEIPETVSR